MMFIDEITRLAPQYSSLTTDHKDHLAVFCVLDWEDRGKALLRSLSMMFVI